MGTSERTAKPSRDLAGWRALKRHFETPHKHQNFKRLGEHLKDFAQTSKNLQEIWWSMEGAERKTSWNLKPSKDLAGKVGV